MSGLVYGCLWVFFNGLARLFLGFKVIGAENFPKKEGVIVAANHASYFDIPLIGCAVSRRLFYLGRANLFPYPFLGWALQKLGWIPLKTHRLDRKAFGIALTHLKEGNSVVIFPEGSRTMDGKLQKGRPGIGYLVAESQCQVIPLFISGTFKVLPVRAKWPRCFPVSVAIGKPIDFSKEFKEELSDSKAFYEKVSSSVMDQIHRLGEDSSLEMEGSSKSTESTERMEN